MKPTKPKKLHLDEIKLEPKLMVRAALDEPSIMEFYDAMEEGAKFPPVDVFEIDGGYYLVDGWHRYHAALKLDAKDIEATIHQGDSKDALTFALKANQSHGIRRTNADKRRAVEVALSEWPELSSRALADLCGVSHEFIEQMRQVSTVDTSTPRRGKDGKQYPATQPKPQPEPEPPPEVSFSDDDPEEHEKKDAAESADADREDPKSDGQLWREWSEHAQEIASMVKDLETMQPGNSKRGVAATACRMLAKRLDAYADRIER